MLRISQLNGFGVRSTIRAPLDGLTAAAAYSTRRLRSAYTGSAIRVRRSSDDAETDIGFTAAGDLNTVALLAHCGAGSGFVATWYDQSGSSRNATQTTLSSQPRIVGSGLIDTLGARSAAFSSVTAAHLAIPAFSGMTSAGVFAIYGHQTANNGSSPWRFIGAGFEHLPFTDGNAYVSAFSASRPGFGAWSAPANIALVASAVQSGTTLAIYRNGAQVGATETTSFTLPSERSIFNSNTIENGPSFVSELIVLSSAPSDVDRQTLERNQGAYFGVLVA